MNSPAERPTNDERRPSLPSYNVNSGRRNSLERFEKSSDEDKTVIGESAEYQHISPVASRNGTARARAHSYLTTAESVLDGGPLQSVKSSSQTREEQYRIADDIQLLTLERKISRIAEEKASDVERVESNNIDRIRSRRDDDVDEFDVATNPVHETTQAYKPPAHPVSKFAKFIKRVHSSSWLVRNIIYATPVALILLIPLLVGALHFDSASVGHVQLVWFMAWLEIVWLTLFAARLTAKCLPWPMGLVSSVFTNNAKKWRDMGKQLELPATLFFWLLAVEISFLPTMKHHQNQPTTETRHWMTVTNKIIIVIFVGTCLNFFEKTIIQLLAMSFHLRTYQSRIEINKFQIGSLTKLYAYSKQRIEMEDRDFATPSGLASGARTPGAKFNEAAQQAQKKTKEAMQAIGDVGGKIAGDFTGKKVTKSTHPSQIVLALLGSTDGSQVLARRLYRTFARHETETVLEEDLMEAFENDSDETAAAFSMFDKDMNGDISMSELEAVCVEIGRERKSITASLKDLDSVVSKLDSVLFFIVCVVVIIVFISLISTSAAGALTSAGSSVLALSWLLSATAQEFLQSCVFVFVKHPFDVGDRVTVYGNTGALGRSDDYFVKSISLLYTEFKKLEGHVVQAPNSYLNTLFILNHRRSGGLAEAITIQLKFGTTLDQIDQLRERLLEFVKQEKRDFQANILTELRELVEMHAINLNVVFFHRTSFQNEGARLARRNKLFCALMLIIQDLGIEGPRMRYPGQKESFPVYLQSVPHIATPGQGHGGNPDNPTGLRPEVPESAVADNPVGQEEPRPATAPNSAMGDAFRRHTSVRGSRSVRRPRNESVSQRERPLDLSLGASDSVAANYSADVYEEAVPRIPIHVIEASRSRRRRETEEHGRQSTEIGRTSSFARRHADHSVVRRSTESDRSRLPNHRNRFFGRQVDGSTADEQSLMEGGMANIPEHESKERIDPRSGLVSPAAWRLKSNEGNIGPRHDPSIAPEDVHTRGESFELPPLRHIRSAASGQSMRSVSQPLPGTTPSNMRTPGAPDLKKL